MKWTTRTLTLLNIFVIHANGLQRGGRGGGGVKPPVVSKLSWQRSSPTAIKQEQPLAARISLTVDEDFRLASPPPFTPRLVGPQENSDTLATELLGEALGTFLIVGIGSMASMAATCCNPFTTTPLSEIALVWSAAVTAAIALCSSLGKHWGSPAHCFFNPAMTLVAALFRGFAWHKVLPYSLAQVAGSTADIVRSTSVETARVFGEYFGSTLSAAQAFGVEAMGTAIMAATAFALTHPSQSLSSSSSSSKSLPLVTGGAVFCLINWLAPYTQCGINPARDFGPRLVAYAAGWTHVAFQDCWVYLVAPLVGATVGAALVEMVPGGRYQRPRRNLVEH